MLSPSKLVLVIGFLLSQPCLSKGARTVYLKNTSVEKIRLTPGRTTVLNFPTKPRKVIVGDQGLFAIEYVEADLAIAPVKSGAVTNLFVYLEGRRFSFELISTSNDYDEIVLVRDVVSQPLKK